MLGKYWSTLVLIGMQLGFGQASASEDSNLYSFRSCVDRKAKFIVTRAAKNDQLWGYNLDLKNKVLSMCSPQVPLENLQAAVTTNNPYYQYVNGAVDAQVDAVFRERAARAAEAERRRAALEAPRVDAEKAEERQAVRKYYDCLLRHARVLAANTNEPAETVVEATYPSCSDAAQALFKTYKKSYPFWSSEEMKRFDVGFRPHLLLEVIKARTQPAQQPESIKKPDVPM